MRLFVKAAPAPFRALAAWALCVSSALVGCGDAPPRVVVYAALDREFSEPLLAEFIRQTGAPVAAKYDAESTKTVGLVNALIQEQRRPRCDVFWNNEILHTLRLEKLGLLEVHTPPEAARFPAEFRSPRGKWHGFAARARVLLVNTRVLPREQWPTSVRDLADPRHKHRAALAKPLFGTTATHAAVLFAAWGREPAEQFFTQVADNAQVLSGNKQVARQVAEGRFAFGLTDTDDAILEVDAGRPVEIVYPDQAPGQDGALLIPNTLCVMKGAPRPKEARALVDFLLTAAVEERLAAAASAQIPLHEAADATRSRAVPTPAPRWMKADFAAAADEWETTAEWLAKTFANAGG